LAVAPQWRGKKIGQYLIRARVELSRAMGIPLTKTIFTAVQSQKLAAKEGFELLGELVYADMKKEDGSPVFPNMHPDHKTIQLMAMRIT
jgi:GNAT superfamily N-acetyltransferase